MPVHSMPDLYTKAKLNQKEQLELNLNLQQGSGDSKTTENDITETVDNSKTHVLDLLKQSKPLTNNDNPIEFNEGKRAHLGDDIQESFLHPSFVKTSKINISSPKTIKKTAALDPKKENPKTKTMKHKFKFA